MNKKRKNQRGKISILLILLVLISLFFITGYYHAVRIGYAMDEIQSSLDIAGIATLNQVVNHQILKDELYGLDNQNKIQYNGASAVLGNYANQIKTEYRSLISFNEDLVPSHEILEQDVYFERSSWGTGSGGTIPQIVIETVVRVRLNISRGHDYQQSLLKRYYSAKRDGTIHVLSVGSTTDGRTELVLRSTVKSLYQ